MYDFIVERYDSVRQKIGKLHTQIAAWEKMSGKVTAAIEKTVPSPKLLDIKKFIKVAFGALGAGGTAFLAMRLQGASEMVMGLLVPIATIVGAIVVPTAIELLKAIPTAMFNQIINRKVGKIERLEKAEKQVAGLHLVKEMGLTGYWMDLEGHLPEKIRAAAFQGDTDTLLGYYNRKKAELEGGKFKAALNKIARRLTGRAEENRIDRQLGSEPRA
jgi:hypothetical protein